MRRYAIPIFSACVLAACSPAPTAADALPAAATTANATSAASVAMPAPAMPEPPATRTAAAPAPAPMPEGSYARYQCGDGVQVDVHYNGIAATVTWPDGRSEQVSQSAVAAEGEAQVYSDRTLRIERAGDGLHLRDGNRAATLCTETEASA